MSNFENGSLRKMEASHLSSWPHFKLEKLIDYEVIQFFRSDFVLLWERFKVGFFHNKAEWKITKYALFNKGNMSCRENMLAVVNILRFACKSLVMNFVFLG